MPCGARWRRASRPVGAFLQASPSVVQRPPMVALEIRLSRYSFWTQMTMKKPIRTIPEFVATLDSRQRKFFLDHLDSRERALQSAVSQLAQGDGQRRAVVVRGHTAASLPRRWPVSGLMQQSLELSRGSSARLLGLRGVHGSNRLSQGALHPEDAVPVPPPWRYRTPVCG